MVKITEPNPPIPGYLERDIMDLGGLWRHARSGAAPASITRVWHGATRAEDADRYLHFLQEKGVQDYLRTPGILDVRIGRRVEGDKAHFWTVSVWKDLDSIKAFAGCPVDKARYYPEDEGFLLEFEPTVLHYETYRVNH